MRQSHRFKPHKRKRQANVANVVLTVVFPYIGDNNIVYY